MYLVLDRIHRKLSRETLFTPFGLKMNKLREEKRGKLEHFEYYSFLKISNVFILAIFRFYTL